MIVAHGDALTNFCIYIESYENFTLVEAARRH